jgi:hypothetical protein
VGRGSEAAGLLEVGAMIEVALPIEAVDLPVRAAF